MNSNQQIRVIVLGLIQNSDRLFVAEGYDSDKASSFYRALGGGINFGESSLDALQREFQEEIQAELTHIQYLECIENRFIYNGKTGHEIVQLYRCDFVDPRFYDLEQIEFFDDLSEPILAQWIACDRFKSGELRLVPETCLKHL